MDRGRGTEGTEGDKGGPERGGPTWAEGDRGARGGPRATRLCVFAWTKSAKYGDRVSGTNSDVCIN